MKKYYVLKTETGEQTQVAGPFDMPWKAQTEMDQQIEGHVDKFARYETVIEDYSYVINYHEHKHHVEFRIVGQVTSANKNI